MSQREIQLHHCVTLTTLGMGWMPLTYFTQIVMEDRDNVLRESSRGVRWDKIPTVLCVFGPFQRIP